jgi:hypothetical protein
MKKLYMFLCIVILFFGIVGCPSSDDPFPTSNIVEKIGSDTSAVPEPITLLLIGSGLLGLGVFGRKRFKK